MDPNTTEENASAGLLQQYHDWLAMGQGGVSANWLGFMTNKTAEFTLARTDTLSPTIYDDPASNASGWAEASASQRANAQRSFFLSDSDTSFLSLPVRSGPRARAKPFIIPQRERNANVPIDLEVKAAYDTAFQRLGDEFNESNDAEWKTSILEKQGIALFLREDHTLSPLVALNKREICHVHASDMSGHVTLSFVDAKEVVEKGWGERHALSGTSWLPLGYTMVYVPNTVEEVDVLVKILRAGVEFMKSG